MTSPPSLRSGVPSSSGGEIGLDSGHYPMAGQRKPTTRQRKQEIQPIEQAMATLLTNQAAFLSQLAENKKSPG